LEAKGIQTIGKGNTKNWKSKKEVIQNKIYRHTCSGDDISKLSIQLKEITDTIEEKRNAGSNFNVHWDA